LTLIISLNLRDKICKWILLLDLMIITHSSSNVLLELLKLKMHKHIIIGLSLIFFTQTTFSQIDSLKYGLKGKTIRALSKTSSTPVVCYAGLKGKNLGSALMYKSDDFGKTWHPLNDGEPISPYAADIQAIAVSNNANNTIYAGTWKDGLYKSNDNGDKWEKIESAPSSDIRSIKTGIQTPELIYAATSAFGVMKSNDGGNTWKRNDPEMIDSSFKFAWSVEIDEKNDDIVFAQTFNRGIWKSTDQGDTWTQALDTENKVCWDMHISKKSNSIWVASSASRDSTSIVYHSPDQGETWQEIADAPQIGINQIYVIEKGSESQIYIGSWNDGIYVQENETWKKLEEIDFNEISEILFHNNELLIGTWGNGTYQVKL